MSYQFGPKPDIPNPTKSNAKSITNWFSSHTPNDEPKKLKSKYWENNSSDPGSGELTKQFVQPEFKCRTTNPLKHLPAESEIKPIEIARQLYLAGKDKNIMIYKFETEGRESGIYLYKIKEQIWQLLLSTTFRNPNTQN